MPIAAPTEEERAQPYLWRFWRHMPRTGRVAIFDRSWYGRVLVERVEGFCTEADWLRAYAEINDFEHQLVRRRRHGRQVLAADQRRRAVAPLQGARGHRFKRFKITDEDWRNREKWDDYVAAVCDMVDRTSTGLAPWTLVEANDKNFARVKVLRTVCERLEAALKDEPHGKVTPRMSDTPYDEHFVSWFRAVTPYINAFRGKTFVIAFGGKAVASEFAKTLAYDVNLLVSLGIRLVLVHGARPQIEEELREKNLESKYHRGYRVTDAETLDCVLDAVGSVYLEIEALLSQGLPNTPMANSRIRVIGGNFITGQPIGVLDGIDMQYAGKVRKVDAEGINAQLGLGNIVLLNCEGPSPTGEIFNLQMEEAAEAVAVAIKADKLVYLTDSRGSPTRGRTAR
jgi:acetylglutamate kinase